MEQAKVPFWEHTYKKNTITTNSVPSYVSKLFNLHKLVKDPYFPKQVLLRNILQNKAENIELWIIYLQ